jgi:hypothetical protein
MCDTFRISLQNLINCSSSSTVHEHPAVSAPLSQMYTSSISSISRHKLEEESVLLYTATGLQRCTSVLAAAAAVAEQL